MDISYNDFVSFLRYKGVYDKFVNNLSRGRWKNYMITYQEGLYDNSLSDLENYYIYKKVKGRLVDLITGAFDWGETNEGFKFWRDINTESDGIDFVVIRRIKLESLSRL